MKESQVSRRGRPSVESGPMADPRQPRRWAFVVIAGGAACALPFMQKPASVPADLQVEVDSAELLAEVLQTPLVSSTAGDGSKGQLIATPTEGQSPRVLPKWAQSQISPLDDLMNKRASLPDSPAPAASTPMQPLRPWIAGPPATRQPADDATSAANKPALQDDHAVATRPGMAVQSDTAATVRTLANESQTPAGPADLPTVRKDWASPHEASPWVDADRETPDKWIKADESPSKLIGMWPDEKFAESSLAEQLRPPRKELQSAIVPREEVLATEPVLPASLPIASSTAAVRDDATKMEPGAAWRTSGATLTSGMRSPSQQAGPGHAIQPPAQFGQGLVPFTAPTPGPASTPLPSLPEPRKANVIFQPQR